MNTDRTAYIKGLRALADALEANPDLILPWEGSKTDLSVFTETVDQLTHYRRLLGKVDKTVRDAGVYGFQITGALEGLSLRVYGDREQVCTRRVIGTREVTKTVPDPDALAAVPTVEVIETVEEVEWDCHPLLAAEQQAVPA